MFPFKEDYLVENTSDGLSHKTWQVGSTKITVKVHSDAALRDHENEIVITVGAHGRNGNPTISITCAKKPNCLSMQNGAVHIQFDTAPQAED